MRDNLSDVLKRAKEAQRESFAQGLVDGMEITLRLLLGEPYAEAEPAPQPLPDDVERWARDALARITEAKP